MKIVFEHSGVLPVIRYGGTERIIFWLMKELVHLGHSVTLIGHPKSDVENLGIKLIPKNDNSDWRKLIPKDTDLIHLFYTPPFKFDFPTIVTIEGNGNPGEKFHVNTVFVSLKHAENHGSDKFVYNGIDLDEYPFVKRSNRKWNNFLFLAKASWKVKNLDHCIDATKKNRKILHLAGGRKWSLSRYVKSYGMVDQMKKRELLSSVDAFLWPVRWHEPFGIGIIEAYSAGLPVIGSTYGSLKELINERVGVLCNDYQEFEKALSGDKFNFNSDEIRSFVETNFSKEVMTRNYIYFYSKVIAGEILNCTEPLYQGLKGPEELLDF